MGIWSRLQGIDTVWKPKEFFQYTNPELLKSDYFLLFMCFLDCIQVEKASCWKLLFLNSLFCAGVCNINTFIAIMLGMDWKEENEVLVMANPKVLRHRSACVGNIGSLKFVQKY